MWINLAQTFFKTITSISFYCSIFVTKNVDQWVLYGCTPYTKFYPSTHQFLIYATTRVVLDGYANEVLLLYFKPPTKLTFCSTILPKNHVSYTSLYYTINSLHVQQWTFSGSVAQGTQEYFLLLNNRRRQTLVYDIIDSESLIYLHLPWFVMCVSKDFILQ